MLDVTRFRFAAVLALCVWLVFATSGLTAETDPSPGWGFVPAEPVEGGPALQGTTWVVQGLGHGLWIKHLEDDERLAYLERQTGLAIDPWASPPGESSRFITFLVVVENRSDMRVSTMMAYIEALGGTLELVARFGNKSIKLRHITMRGTVEHDAPVPKRTGSGIRATLGKTTIKRKFLRGNPRHAGLTH